MAGFFPLDAEQIVRGLGFVLHQWFNRTRPPDHAAISLDAVTLTLGKVMGVPLPTEEVTKLGLVAGSGTRKVLLPYGSPITTSQQVKPSLQRPPVELQRSTTWEVLGADAVAGGIRRIERRVDVRDVETRIIVALDPDTRKVSMLKETLIGGFENAKPISVGGFRETFSATEARALGRQLLQSADEAEAVASEPEAARCL